jgi:hypothetical protein
MVVAQVTAVAVVVVEGLVLNAEKKGIGLEIALIKEVAMVV